MRQKRVMLLIATGAMLAASVAMLGLAQEPKSGPVEKRIVLIPGTKAWVPTGIMLREVDKVTLTAAGKVCFSSGNAQSCPGPSGWPRANYQADWPDDANACDDPLGNANHAMVLARVGNDVFPAGASRTFTGKAGPLALGINDCSFTGAADALFNTGEYSVVLRVERAR
jgi:hypothetical protein